MRGVLWFAILMGFLFVRPCSASDLRAELRQSLLNITVDEGTSKRPFTAFGGGLAVSYAPWSFVGFNVAWETGLVKKFTTVVWNAISADAEWYIWGDARTKESAAGIFQKSSRSAWEVTLLTGGAQTTFDFSSYLKDLGPNTLLSRTPTLSGQNFLLHSGLRTKYAFTEKMSGGFGVQWWGGFSSGTQNKPTANARSTFIMAEWKQ